MPTLTTEEQIFLDVLLGAETLAPLFITSQKANIVLNASEAFLTAILQQQFASKAATPTPASTSAPTSAPSIAITPTPAIPGASSSSSTFSTPSTPSASAN